MLNPLAPLVVLLAVCSPALGQSSQIGPSVLDLTRDYHVGLYSASIDVPGGAVHLFAQRGGGGLHLGTGGTVAGALDSYEWSGAGGTFTPNDPLAGTYFVAPDGRIEFDLDPQNPGTELFEAWMAPDGEAFHMARYELDSEAVSLLALAKSSGHTNASLAGTYRICAQRLELATGGYETTAEHGTVVFDGVGGAVFTGTEMFVATNGIATTTPASGSASYVVAADGALSLAGGVDGVGAIDATGDVFFFVTASATSSEVGMTIGVRVAQNSNLAAFDGIYTYHAQGHELGTSAGLPRTVTDVGRLTLTATAPTTGGYQFDGKTYYGDAAGQSFAWRTVVGPDTFANPGVVTLIGGPPIELVFSASGRYAVGRAVDNRADLWFALRGTAECSDYGSATAGSGSIEPELGMRTFPTLGNSGWRFAVTDGLGGAPAVLALGFSQGPWWGIPFAGGLLMLDPSQIAVAPFVVLGGPTGTPGAGAVDVPLAVPAHPSYAGMTLFAQALVLDAGAPGSVAMSRGFRAVFSR